MQQLLVEFGRKTSPDRPLGVFPLSDPRARYSPCGVSQRSCRKPHPAAVALCEARALWQKAVPVPGKPYSPLPSLRGGWSRSDRRGERGSFMRLRRASAEGGSGDLLVIWSPRGARITLMSRHKKSNQKKRRPGSALRVLPVFQAYHHQGLAYVSRERTRPGVAILH